MTEQSLSSEASNRACLGITSRLSARSGFGLQISGRVPLLRSVGRLTTPACFKPVLRFAMPRRMRPLSSAPKALHPAMALHPATGSRLPPIQIYCNENHELGFPEGAAGSKVERHR
jgi:hypothetical protein